MLEDPNSVGLRWLFLDLNSYFASVEQNEHPHLRGRPVAVVPMMTDATCAIAASYEAKAYGIKTGTKIYDAKKMCPHLICVLASHNLYVDYHHRILEAVGQYLPINKIWSIDEFDCELMGREKQPGNARKIARAIKDAIHRDVGPAINCSIGIAPNSFLAKVATEIEKPDGLVLLPPEDLPGRLLELNLTDLPGINVSMLARLQRARIMSVRDLWHTSPKQARAVWHSVQGERFWYWLHGYDVPYQSTRPSMIGHSRVLDPNMRTPEPARLMARRLLFKAVTRLRRKGFHASRLTLSVRLLDGRRWAMEAQFPAARDAFTLLEQLDALWAQMLRDTGHRGTERRMVFKKLSTLLTGLRGEGDVTDDLFDTGLADTRRILSRRERLSGALDRLQHKYKQEVVHLGVTPKTLAGHVGTKIAFSRVPDKEEFWE